MGRDLSLIILEIIKIIPDTEKKLLNELSNYLNENLAYKSPELRVSKFCWTPFINILNSNITNIELERQKKILDIINTKEE